MTQSLLLRKGWSHSTNFFSLWLLHMGDSEALRQTLPRLSSGKDQIVNIHALWNGMSIQIFLILSILQLFRNVKVILSSLKYRPYCTSSPWNTVEPQGGRSPDPWITLWRTGAPQVRFLLDIVTRMESKRLLCLGCYARWGLESQPVLPRSTYWDWAQASIYTHISLLKKKKMLPTCWSHWNIVYFFSTKSNFLFLWIYLCNCLLGIKLFHPIPVFWSPPFPWGPMSNATSSKTSSFELAEMLVYRLSSHILTV